MGGLTMVKQVSADGFVFEFGDDVVDAVVFDDKANNPMKDTMKAVDVIAEFPEEYLFIELKKYSPDKGGIEFKCPLWGDKRLIATQCPLSLDDKKRSQSSVKRIVSDLRGKYCDTMLCRYAENKLTKTVNYICVVEGCDSAQTLQLFTILKQMLPTGIPAKSNWVRPLLKNVAVVNVKTWNATEQLAKYGKCSVAV